MTKISSLGYPRLGEKREWKKFELKDTGLVQFVKTSYLEEAGNFVVFISKKQLNAGLDFIPVGDFSLL